MKLKVQEIAIFAMLGALMFSSKILMEFLPNIHLLGVFTMAITIVYRAKALYPIYIYVFINGLYAGFNVWWVPYLYIWTVLWGVTMLLPKNMPKKVAPIVYMVVCGLHGFLFGTLYAPAQALFFGYDFKTTLAWIATGIPYDLIHGVSNLVCGSLILPIVKAIRATDRRIE
ncbi:MAG: hypothetical protein IJW29_07185 [Clostridia bacterium]|nr:hypothetical protein [Clostridia bacterium]